MQAKRNLVRSSSRASPRLSSPTMCSSSTTTQHTYCSASVSISRFICAHLQEVECQCRPEAGLTCSEEANSLKKQTHYRILQRSDAGGHMNEIWLPRERLAARSVIRKHTRVLAFSMVHTMTPVAGVMSTGAELGPNDSTTVRLHASSRVFRCRTCMPQHVCASSFISCERNPSRSLLITYIKDAHAPINLITTVLRNTLTRSHYKELDTFWRRICSALYPLCP